MMCDISGAYTFKIWVSPIGFDQPDIQVIEISVGKKMHAIFFKRTLDFRVHAAQTCTINLQPVGLSATVQTYSDENVTS